MQRISMNDCLIKIAQNWGMSPRPSTGPIRSFDVTPQELQALAEGDYPKDLPSWLPLYTRAGAVVRLDPVPEEGVIRITIQGA